MDGNRSIDVEKLLPLQTNLGKDQARLYRYHVPVKQERIIPVVYETLH